MLDEQFCTTTFFDRGANLKRNALTCTFVVAVLGIASLPTRAGQDRPFKGRFDFVLTSVSQLPSGEVLITANMEGNGAHLGRFRGEVGYVVDFTTGTFYGSLYKAAANGDLVFEDLTGAFTATGSEGAFVVTGGTGRFLNASGEGTYINAWTNAAQTAGRVVFDGTIAFDASDRR